MALVFLTGSSGFIGLHQVHELFQNGYDILAVVRNESRTKQIREIAKLYPRRKVEFEFVEDMGDPHAYDDAFKKHPDIKYVIHLSTPTANLDSAPEDQVQRATDGVINLLNAANKYGKNVERFVYTTSIAAFVDMTGTADPPAVVNEESWLPFDKEDANKDEYIAYSVSKKYAEKAFWNYLENEKPQFLGVTIAPVTTIGRSLEPADTLDEHRMSIKDFYAKATGKSPQDQISNIVHVKDIAKAHVIALTNEHAPGSRWIVSLPSVVNKQLVEMVGIAEPDKSVDVDKALAVTNYDNSKTNKELGIEYIDLQTAVKEIVDDLSNKDIL